LLLQLGPVDPCCPSQYSDLRTYMTCACSTLRPVLCSSEFFTNSLHASGGDRQQLAYTATLTWDAPISVFCAFLLARSCKAFCTKRIVGAWSPMMNLAPLGWFSFPHISWRQFQTFVPRIFQCLQCSGKTLQFDQLIISTRQIYRIL
jgi:hypothetical protein